MLLKCEVTSGLITLPLGAGLNTNIEIFNSGEVLVMGRRLFFFFPKALS